MSWPDVKLIPQTNQPMAHYLVHFNLMKIDLEEVFPDKLFSRPQQLQRKGWKLHKLVFFFLTTCKSANVGLLKLVNVLNQKQQKHILY